MKPKAFNSQAFRLEMVRMTAKITKDMEKDYRKTTAKWKKKPTWLREVNYSSSKITTFVGTENEIYGYIDYGTKPHLIVPRRKTVLRFLGSSYGGSGRPKGGDYVFAKYVNHPGFKGYKHSKRLLKKWKPLSKKRFDAAMRVAAQKSGHAIK